MAALTRMVSERPRSGYRMLHGRLVDEGFKVGRDRVHRLCRRHGLRVPRRRRVRRATGESRNAVHVRRAACRNDVWTWDFVSDQTMNDGRPFRILTVVDEYTREPLLTHVARRINSAEVIRQLGVLFERQGVPRHIRSDNGPEFIARALRSWLKENRVEVLYVEPGSPWQNGIAESFNGRLRDECLSVEAFYSLQEARVVIEDYRRYFRDRRPHSSLGYIPPKRFVEACLANGGVCPAKTKAKENRVDGAGDEAPLPLQTSHSTPHETQALTTAPTTAPTTALMREQQT
ncbi:MAG: IS3 family transposase [Phycisphaerales bacterium]|nr:IS3 family transposase [Phycisphaerales bacterium]